MLREVVRASTAAATLHGYELRWPGGADNLFLTSIGTGSRTPTFQPQQALRMASAMVGLRSLHSVIADASWHAQAILQWLSRSSTPWVIDSELGDLDGDLLGGQEWLTYVRYDLRLENPWLAEHLGIQRTSEELRGLFALDNPNGIDGLYELGAAAAASQVRPEHFGPRFDLQAQGSEGV
jgi:hypothetical protein